MLCLSQALDRISLQSSSHGMISAWLQEEALNGHLAVAKRKQEAEEAAAPLDERTALFATKREQAQRLQKEQVS